MQFNEEIERVIDEQLMLASNPCSSPHSPSSIQSDLAQEKIGWVERINIREQVKPLQKK